MIWLFYPHAWRKLEPCFVSVAALHRYPVKSCLGEALQSAKLGAGGTLGDRGFVVACSGQVLTQRECPQLAAIVASMQPGRALKLSLRDDSTAALEVSSSAGSGEEVRGNVFGSPLLGVDQGDEAAAWVSAAAGVEGCRLLKRSPKCPRRAVGSHWSDVAPLLIVSEASVAALCQSAGREIPVDRFRPNIVLAGSSEPHAEESWQTIRAGSVTLQSVGPCGRCAIVEVDQDTAQRDSMLSSAYWALMGYRGKAVFGQYFRVVPPVDGEDKGDIWGQLDLGNEVEVV